MSSDRQSLIASIVLHGIALGALALFIHLNLLQAEEQPLVLELVDLPDEVPPAQPTEPMQPSPAIDRTPIQPAVLRELPEVNIPEPEPDIEPDPPPPPAAVRPEPTPAPTPRPEPTPAPKPAPPKPQPIDINQFRQDHGVRRVDKPTPTPRPSPQPAPRINAPKLDLSGITVAPSPTAPTANADAVAKYQGRLKTAIELKWDKPSAGSGTEWAEISFRVFSNGSIGEIKVNGQNGPTAFVESVKQAIASTAPIGPRPSGWDGRMTITFRLQ